MKCFDQNRPNEMKFQLECVTSETLLSHDQGISAVCMKEQQINKLISAAVMKSTSNTSTKLLHDFNENEFKNSKMHKISSTNDLERLEFVNNQGNEFNQNLITS